MLPDIRLDDENFEEIVEKARKMIPGLHSEWTDFNYHDPGITFLELFAWMKEMQQYHMDQIGERHRRKYWKLLGIIPKDRQPAKAMLTVRGREGFLPRGSRFYAGEVCFETVEQEYLSETRITQGVRTDAEGSHLFSMEEVGGLRIPLFGKSPKGGEQFHLALSAPLKEQVEHHLYVKIYDGYPVKRNPLGEAESFLPLASIQFEALTGDGFEEVELIRDETHQFLFSGYLKFRLKKAMAEKEGQYWLRFTLLEEGYDTAPKLCGASLHTFLVRQQRTLAECVDLPKAEREFLLDSSLAETGQMEFYIETAEGWRLYEGEWQRSSGPQGTALTLGKRKPGENQLAERLSEGNQSAKNQSAEKIRVFCYETAFYREREVGEGTGFPYQEFELDIPGLGREGFLLMAETYPGSGCYREWSRVEDFDNSGPEDLHYILEAETLRFGDCYHGCAPEGRIFIGACTTSLGAGGNVKAGSIQRWESPLLASVLNEEHAFGGTMAETPEDCEGRVRELFLHTERAVTYEDYEELALRTPGLRVRAVKAVPVTDLKRQDGSMEETRVALAIAPFSEEERRQPGTAYLKNILRMLEPKRMIGTRVQLLPSEYVGVSVFAEVTADSYYEQVRLSIGRALEEYFEGVGREFGLTVRHSDIYGLLDTLPGVGGVRTVTLDAKGRGVKTNRNGDLLLPTGGLAYLKDWECMITSAE